MGTTASSLSDAQVPNGEDVEQASVSLVQDQDEGKEGGGGSQDQDDGGENGEGNEGGREIGGGEAAKEVVVEEKANAAEVEVLVEEKAVMNDVPVELNLAMTKEPSDLSLYLRHRSPPKACDDTDDAGTVPLIPAAKVGRHRQELDRIYKDSAAYTRHDLVFDDADQDSDEPWKWCCNKGNKQQRQQQDLSPKKVLQHLGLMPFQQLIGVEYTWQTLQKDFIAGVSVAIVAIPLSMSYAKLAGLPAYYGLYGNLPACVYPIFGSSKQLAVGPAALVSLLLSTGISQIVARELPGSEESSDEYMARYAQLAIQCSFMVGILKIAFGILKLGFVTQILSKALISGFTSGAAIMIVLSQTKYLLGVSVPPAQRIQDVVKHLIEEADNFSWKTFLMGALVIVTLLSLKKAKELNPHRPLYKWLFAAGPVLVSGISIILTYTLDLGDHGIFLVGNIPKGLPKITVDLWMPFSNDLWVRSIQYWACVGATELLAHFLFRYLLILHYTTGHCHFHCDRRVCSSV